MSDLDDIGGGLDELAARGLCPFAEMTNGRPKWAHCCDGYGGISANSCGAHWANHEAKGHCSRCHLTFGSDAAFDKHLPGNCRTPDELLADGWTAKTDTDNTADIWRTPAPAIDPWSKK